MSGLNVAKRQVFRGSVTYDETKTTEGLIFVFISENDDVT